MEALKELLYKIADDQLILGHRNSEWTGLGPTLEEDIAFSSMSQDKVGHAHALYKILNEELGEAHPDKLAFGRRENDFKCCHLVEIYTKDYSFALIRHFLFDHAESLRFKMLSNSSAESLAKLARKIKGELKYHTMHGDVWVKKLGSATDESRARMQAALNETYPLALGIFEEGPYEEELKEKGIFYGETALKEEWIDTVHPIIEAAGLTAPKAEPALGGRKGYHTEHLQPLLMEMTEVFAIDPEAEW